MQIFFISGICPDILMNALKNCIVLFFGVASFGLIKIISSKNKGFQSGALLKIPPSSPSMQEFGLDIQKLTKFLK